jgi:hypothetical protein
VRITSKRLNLQPTRYPYNSQHYESVRGFGPDGSYIAEPSQPQIYDILLYAVAIFCINKIYRLPLNKFTRIVFIVISHRRLRAMQTTQHSKTRRSVYLQPAAATSPAAVERIQHSTGLLPIVNLGRATIAPAPAAVARDDQGPCGAPAQGCDA